MLEQEKNSLKLQPRKKIRVGLMSYAMDLRRGKGTAIYARQLISNLLDDDRFDFFLIHYEKIDDPLYQKATEIIIPHWIYPSRFLRQLYFFWLFRKEPFDILHWFQPRLYPGYWWAPTKYIIATIHGGGKFYYPKFSVSARVFDWVLRFAHQAIDCSIVVTNNARLEAIETYGLTPKKVAVTYNGGGERFVPRNKLEAYRTITTIFTQINRPYILNVSRLQPHKNIANLILAYIHLRQYTKRTESLVIVGWPTEQFDGLYKLARDSQYTDDIHFINFVEDEHLNDLYSAAEIFVFPSLSEGFGLPLVEAMSAGTPVITSNVSSMPEVVGNSAILVDPNNYLDIAQAMEKLLNDPGLRRHSIALGLDRAREFTWQKTAEGTKQIYLDLMENGKITHTEAPIKKSHIAPIDDQRAVG